MSGKPSIFMCGINSGTHLFLPISRIGETILLKMPDPRVAEFSIKATQIDCRWNKILFQDITRRT